MAQPQQPPANIGPAGAVPDLNPFRGNGVGGPTDFYTAGDPGQFDALYNDPGGTGAPVNINDKLNTLRQNLQTKFNNTRVMAANNNRINRNLLIIKNRIGKLAQLIQGLIAGVAQAKYDLAQKMDKTLDNIIQDLGRIEAVGAEQLIAEIAAINAELDTIRDTHAPAYGVNAGDPLYPAEFDAPADAVPGPHVNAPNPDGTFPDNTPRGYMGGGRKAKKGGYTYPKMRSRSRLRSHPRVMHQFNTIKPKKRSTRKRGKHKSTSKKHKRN